MNDIDIYIHNEPMSIKFKDSVNKYLYGNNNFKFADISIKGFGEWVDGGKKEYLSEWFGKEWPNMYGSESMDETVFNPDFHYYYFGLKIIMIKADIVRRIKRSRPASFADLIAIKKFIYSDLEIPKIPDGFWYQNEYKKYTRDVIFKMINTVKNYLRHRYNINMDHKAIKIMLTN
jgi:hypothetical protein